MAEENNLFKQPLIQQSGLAFRKKSSINLAAGPIINFPRLTPLRKYSPGCSFGSNVTFSMLTFSLNFSLVTRSYNINTDYRPH